MSVFLRVLGAVSLAGILRLTASTVAVVLLVQDDKEATLVDSAMQVSGQHRDALRARLALARAQLRSAAYAAEAGRLTEVLAAVEGTASAVLGWQGDEEFFEAAGDDSDLELLREAGRGAPEDLRLFGNHAIISVRIGVTEVAGLVPLSDLLTFPPGWNASVDSDVSVPSIRATRTTSTVSVVAPVEGNLGLRVVAPLGPARHAAFSISKRVIATSALVLAPLFFLAWLLARGVASPIRLLLRTVRDSRTLPIRVPTLPNDEVGDLGEAIAEMSRRLHRDESALQRALVLGKMSLDDAPAYLTKLNDELCALAGSWRFIESPAHVEFLKELGSDPESLRGTEEERSKEASEAVALDDGLFVIPFHDGERDYGLAVAQGVSEEDVRVAEVLTRTALSHLRNHELERQAGVGEKLTMLARLSASVAHEMNTPLAFVNANLLAIEEEPLNEDSLEMVQDARQGVQRIIRIVRDLSAVAAGGREASNESVLMDELLNDVSRMAKTRRPDGCVEIDAAHDLCVQVDRGRLEQVIVNLVNNGLDAAPGGKVQISARRADAMVIVEVSDNGTGISPKMQRRLFEAFNTSKGAKGTGLGLYISRSLVEAHGGTLELISSDSTGTTFRVSLPDGGPAGSRPSARAPMARRPRVLIVDDDPAIVRSMQRWLKKRADVKGTTDANEGLKLMTSEDFDLMLCDMNMPDLGGREIAEILRRDHPELVEKLVILTGSASEAPKNVRVVRKPLDPRLADALLFGSQENSCEG